MILKTLLLLTITLFTIIEYAIADEDPHIHHKVQKIQVLGDLQSSSLFDAVPSVSIISNDKLMKTRAASLGETLKNEVGITSSSYGPAASRPIIRGLGGDRIRILQNGLGILDASGASQDHAISLDPLSMDKIEIVRGPLSLLYGSSAIGGVINIITNRTHESYEEGFSGAADTQLGSVDSSGSVSFKGDYGFNKWMIHTDIGFRKSQDLKIKGFARSKEKRLQDPLPINQEVKNTLTNSASESLSLGLGGTYFINKGYVGLSASTFLTDYGVVAEEDVTIDMSQSRFDLISEFKDIGPFKSLRLKSAQSIYKHQELEDSSVGTTFKNNGNETRLELVQNKWKNINGLFGLQTNYYNFSALGDEAYLPETKNLALALFVFEDLKLNEISTFNVGARLESNSVDPVPNSTFSFDQKKEFTLGSLAFGYSHNLNQKFKLSTQLSYNERAPNYQELFANGAHVATFSYQVGDVNLNKERAFALDASLKYFNKNISSIFTIFGQNFSNYITLKPTGTYDDTDNSGGYTPDDLPIYNYESQKALIYGLEFDTQIQSIFSVLKGDASLNIKADYLVGRNLDDNENLPRITPPRFMLGLSQKWADMSADLEVQEVFRQNKLAPNELPTDAYTMVNLGFTYKVNQLWDMEQLSIFARVNNVFDVEARNHVSVLKDLAQLGGRNFSLGIRSYF